MTEPTAIVPDDKDWTWVITEGCPECGFRPGPSDEVAGWVRGVVPRWRAVLERGDVGERPSPQVWSPLEYACHVRDVCRVFGVRTHLMLSQNDPAFANWDQDATAIEERYHEQDPATVADEFTEEAHRTAELFDTVGEGDWERPGTRSNGSKFTVATLLIYFQHDLYHHLHDVRG